MVLDTRLVELYCDELRRFWNEERNDWMCTSRMNTNEPLIVSENTYIRDGDGKIGFMREGSGPRKRLDGNRTEKLSPKAYLHVGY